MESIWKKGITPPDKTFGGDTLKQAKKAGTFDKPVPTPAKPKLPEELEKIVEGDWKPEMTREEADIWAGDSKIKDDVFHGTNIKAGNQIRKTGFSDGAIGENTGNNGAYGKGHYFTTFRGYAGGYADNQNSHPGEGTVLVGKIQLKNPLRSQDPGYKKLYQDAIDEAMKSGRGDWIHDVGNLIADKVKKKGHDGILIGVGSKSGILRDEIVIFSKKSIVIIEE